MKKILLTLMAACAAFSFASAQETGFGFGVKAGVNISNQTLDDAAKYKAGFTGGVFVDYRTCNWFAVSADVLYSRQGSKIKDSDVKLRTDYLNIPVLANFYLTRGMALKAGVQPGFLLAAKAKEGDVKVDVKEMYKTFDLSIPVGLSYDFKFGLILDARRVGEQKLLLPHKPCYGMGKCSSLQRRGDGEGQNSAAAAPCTALRRSCKDGCC